MDQATLFEAIDEAITNVAEAEFRRLAEGMTRDELTNNVHRALASLRGLQDGIPPGYEDSWVPLLYLTWYQPGQIYYAHHMIHRMNQNRSGTPLIAEGSYRLHLVDFGCGSLAMQFAVTWAAAEALESGLTVKEIRIDSYDVATPMIRLGQALWDEFKRIITDDAQVSHLAMAVSSIRPRNSSPNRLFPYKAQMPGEERWLSALHTVYEDNLDAVRIDLAKMTNAFKPDIGLMSCFPNPTPIGLLEQASPFTGDSFLSAYAGPSYRTEASLPKVTRWRRDLDLKIDRHHFLEGNVPWYRHAFGLIYTPKG
ncbi:MAG: hypothetical protein J4F43_07415 [Dehalococcoidia bacterium]|nr:hypothetical protein [Dehalococcoidia bacterium]